MHWIPRKTAIVIMIAVGFQAPVSAMAATGATIEGTIEIPCDPSRVKEVASIRITPVSGGESVTVPADPSTGVFVAPGLSEGAYDLQALGTEGLSLSPGPTRVLARSGLNTLLVSMRPPGCGGLDTDRNGVLNAGAGGSRQAGNTVGLKMWQNMLIVAGFLAVAVVAHENRDDADGVVVSPFQP